MYSNLVYAMKMTKELETEETHSTSTYKNKRKFVVKFLTISFLVLIIVLLALVSFWLIKESSVCNSEYCIKTSAYVLKNIDASRDPCTDLNGFICGQQNVGSLQQFENITNQLNGIILEPINSSDSSTFLLQKLLYQSCMDVALIEMDGDETWMNLLYALGGGWPLVQGSSWNDTGFNWMEFTILAKNLGLKFDWFLQLEIYQDYDNLLMIKIPKYLKPISQRRQFHYSQLMADVAVGMGGTRTGIHYEIAQTVQFENQLGQLAEKHRQRNKLDENYVKITIADLQRISSHIDWETFLHKLTGQYINDKHYVIFDLIDYMDDLYTLLNETPKRIQVNFLMWKLTEKFWPFLTEEIRFRFEQFNRQMFGKQFINNRMNFCLAEAKKQFKLTAEMEFLKRHVTNAKRYFLQEMVYKIKDHLLRYFEIRPWLDTATKHYYINNILNSTLIIGESDEFYNDNTFAKLFGLYNFHFQSRNIIKMLTERRRKLFFEYYALLNRRFLTRNLINFYEANETTIRTPQIKIPAAYLQNDFFNIDQPTYISYGLMGALIVQELLRSLFESNILNEWWTSPHFNHVFADCFLKSHNQIDMEIIKNQVKTYIGVDIVYEAYKQGLVISEPSSLPGLQHYDGNQLFWIQIALFSCSNTKQVNVIQSSLSFNQDFKCTSTISNNLKDKCVI